MVYNYFFWITLNNLKDLIFAGLSSQQYLNKDYLYEKKLQKKCARVMFILSRLKKQNLEHLYEIIISFGNLRYRVKDHSTFGVIYKELEAIDKSISLCFKHKNANKLLEHIESLEEVYYSVLQVVAEDPAVFLFFIQQLRALHDEMIRIKNT